MTPTPPRDVLVQVVAEMRDAAQVERDRSWEGAPHGADEWRLDDWADRIERALAGQGEAAKDVIAERERQKNIEGWTPDHDDEHEYGELADAAACYAKHAGQFDPARPKPMHRLDDDQECPSDWPWDADWWKPKDRRRDLVRAGALILAEIERLDRIASRATS